MAPLITPPPPLPEPQPIRHRTAEISACDRYRYRLTREWSDAVPATFVMLNPSTADADQDDATTRKCARFAQRWGCGSLIIVNLYAWRATNPSNLPADELLRVGPDNDRHLSDAAAAAHEADGPLIAAWGANAHLDRVAAVCALPGVGRLACLSVTGNGQPSHPLYLNSDATPSPWRPR
ncbi:DUF1643 domain-containing protein [Streptomyces sp. NPDC058657]|uniref:DUF1643 domain-containing protein n=1 Tax=unclassified Streptomyces TaxID=2593676 RepID=UPI00365C8A03